MREEAKLIVQDGARQIQLFAHDEVTIDGIKYPQSAPSFILGVGHAMSMFAETLRNARNDAIEDADGDVVREEEIRHFADILRKRLQRKAGSLSVKLAYNAIANRSR